MRMIRYPRWLRPMFLLMLGSGLLAILWPPSYWAGMGLLVQAGYLSFGFVCIYLAELETDALTQAMRESGDWTSLTTRLTCYRTEHPEAWELLKKLQQQHRLIWREYQQSRRYLMRQRYSELGALEASLAACNQRARDWLQHLEAKLASRNFGCGPGEEVFLRDLAAFRGVDSQRSLHL